jgi:RNA recognition motif-containing protein
MMLNSRYEPSNFTISDSSSIAPDSFMATSDDSSNSRISGANNLLSASAILLVKNLPALLFSEPSDLDPLMRPFGSIQTMQVLNSEMDRTSPSAVTSAVVEYKTLIEAQEAQAHLHGQVYAGLSLEVEYIQAGVPLEPSQLGSWRSSYRTIPLSSSGQRKHSSPLNPFAAPFVAESQNDLFAPGFGFNSNPNSSFNPAVFYPQNLELKPYHQAAMSPTEPSTKTHAQGQDLYLHQCQTQYPAHAISIQPFSNPQDASYYKTLDRNFCTGFMSNSVNSGCALGFLLAFFPIHILYVSADGTLNSTPILNPRTSYTLLRITPTRLSMFNWMQCLRVWCFRLPGYSVIIILLSVSS